MPAHVTEEELYQALADALTLAEEFKGMTIEQKLAAFGLDSEEARAMIYERAAELPEHQRVPFAQGFGEGLISGVALVRRARSR